MFLNEKSGISKAEKPWHRLWPKNIPKHISYPHKSLGDLLTVSSKDHPKRTALIYYDKHITYEELDQLSNKFAWALKDLDVKKGDRVALLLPNTPQFIIAFYGAVKCGAIVTSLNPIDREHEIEHQLLDSGAETVLTLDLFYPTLSKIIDKINLKNVIVSSLKDYMPKITSVIGNIFGKIPSHHVELKKNHHQFQKLLSKYDVNQLKATIDPSNDVAVLQYTGGTTGIPKGAMLTHMNLISNTVMCATWIGTKSDAAYLSILPFFHSYGMTTGILAPLYIGARIVLFPNFRSKQVLQAIQKYQIIVFCGVPTLYERLLTNPELGKYNYSSLKYCISGADPLKPELRKRFTKTFSSAVLVEGYGLSEASPITHSHPLESSEKYKVGSIGIPWPDTDAKIVDQEKGEITLKNGEYGELIIKGPQIMKGYWNKPDETASALRDGWLYTGDLGKMDEEGYFYLVDRKKDLIKYKGHSVYPRELEEILYKHPVVKSCSVIGKPDQIAGEIPKAFVVLNEGATISEQELMSFVNEKVAYYKAIREIEFRNDLPTNIIGKVLKRVLRDEEKNKN